jgi:multiple sugar transport system substrate-binding protein
MCQRIKQYTRLLSAVFMVALFIQGSSPHFAAAQERVTIGFVYGAFAPQERWEAYFDDFLAENPHVTINYIPVPLDNWGDYAQRIVTLMVGGEQVDVIWNAIEGVPMMAERGVLLSLDSYIESDPDIEEFLDDVHPMLLEGLRWNDQQYLLPFAWNSPLIYYNKAVLEEAGLPEPPADWTWDEFLEYALAITEDTDGDGVPNRWGFHTPFSTWALGPWTIANGSFWMNEDFSEPWYDRPETIEAVQFAHSLIWEHRVAPSGEFNVNEAFAAGALGMMSGAPANREALIPAGMSPDDYDITFWPKNTDSDVHGSIWGTDGYGITQSSPNPDVAWEMVKHLVSVDVMSHLLSGEFASASAPARLSLANDPRLVEASPSNYQYFYEALDGARTVINSPNFAELNEIHTRYMSLAWANEISVEEAMTSIQAEMEALIAQGN